MIVIGLTGSIGMGKSTTAAMFRDEGLPVYDADMAVHRLYRGHAVAPVEEAFPGVTQNGEINRLLLRKAIAYRVDGLKLLESIVHPLVRGEETVFVAKAKASGFRQCVLDIPLLLETANWKRCDAIVVVTATAEVQRARVMARPGMTDEVFEKLSSRQMPDAEKRRHAHFLVDSGHGLDSGRRQVQAILRAVAGC